MMIKGSFLFVMLLWLTFIANAQRNFDFQGHRGARGLVPENTIPSMIKALELGVTTLELDVVISKDHKVIVSHEPYMSATISTQPTGEEVLGSDEKSYNIYQMTYEEIKAWDVGSKGHAGFSRQERMAVFKPELGELIKAVEKYAMANKIALPAYNIEIKSTKSGEGVYHPFPQEFVKLVMDVINSHSIAERTTIQSFDTRPLVVLHQQYPTIRLALLVANPRGINRNIKGLGFVPDIYSPYYKLVSSKTVHKAHQKDMQIIPWTVNDVPTMVKLINKGVDGIISDYPDLFNDEDVVSALEAN